MKTTLGIAFLIGSTAIASAQFGGSTYNTYGGSSLYGTGSNPNSHYVSPYVRSNGTYMGGHYQTNPNNTQLDNFGSRGNYNPYKGSYGTRIPRY